jgi:hypothetical protein
VGAEKGSNCFRKITGDNEVPLIEEVKTKVEVKCDGPDCTVSYRWINEEVGQDAEKLPDPVSRFIIFAEFLGGKAIFCGKYCLLQWLKKYEAPKTPREKRELEEEAKKVRAEKDAEAQRLLEIAENEGLK